jgi:hypothetical protein
MLCTIWSIAGKGNREQGTGKEVHTKALRHKGKRKEKKES